MKIYTRRGDDGKTDLFGGQRVSKDSLRVECFGAVDELNSWLGMALVSCVDESLRDVLTATQSRLFDLGADLATPRKDGADPAAITRIDAEHVAELERHIDAIEAIVLPMKVFILPGGTELAARLHVARTVCRRAERLCVALQSHESIGEHVVKYLNRLSDLLFTMARRANQLAGVEDVPWVSSKRKKE